MVFHCNKAENCKKNSIRMYHHNFIETEPKKPASKLKTKRKEKNIVNFFWEYRKLVYALILSLSSGSNNIMIRGRLNERLAVFSGWRYDTGGVLFGYVGILMSRVFGVVWGSRGVVWSGWSAVDVSRFFWVIPTMMSARSGIKIVKMKWFSSN